MSETCPNSEFKDDRHDWEKAMLPKHTQLTGEWLEICERCLAFRVRVARMENGIPQWYSAQGELTRVDPTSAE